MKITLYLKDKIIVFKLPKEISGSFSFDVDKEEESKLINVEARENGWVLYETKDVKVFADNTFVKEVPLISNHFYILQRDQKNYLIHASELGKSSFAPYRYQKDLNLTIGFKDAALSFACPYLNFSLKISYKNGRLTLEKPENALVYINKHSIFASSYFLSNGDELEIFGLRLIFLTNLVLIESRCDVTLNSEMAHLQKDKFPPLEKSENLEVKDVDLYNPDDYFSKSPRIRRLIETKKIKLSNPPRDADANQLPLILVIGPMFTMGMVSFIMLLNTVIRITNKETTLADSWPQLVISGSMMISMLLWPLITQLYNKRMRKKKQRETIEKYTAYLEEKKDELRQEKNLQREILMENLIPVSECLQIIKSRGVNFWDKRMDQSDFLTARLGVGNELLDVEIEYPDEDFTVEENELRKKADALVAEFKYIENVPIGYSFYENKATAIMGITHKIHYFLENILLQLMTFYSYEDLKIVLFTKEENQDQWAYLRYLNHTFSNAKDFRFFASNQEDAKIVTEYLNNEFNQRINLVGKVNSFAPYYLIVVEDYDMIKHYDLIKNITEIYNTETENGLADYNYEDYFASYLQSKGIDNLTITHSSLQLEGLSEQVKDKKMADLKEAIKEGNQVILKINSASYYGLSDKDNDGQFDLKSYSTYPKTINVVGMTDNGYFIVSNCGEFSLLPFDADILQHDILEYKQEEKIDSTSQKLEAEESPSKLDPTPSIFYDFSQIEQILNLNDWSRGIYLLDNNYIGDQPKFQNFGGSQSSLSRNSSQFIEDPIVLDIVKKYYPDVTEEDLELLFYQMNSGGCGYVAFINSIAKEFEDRPEEFEEKFGYELSTIKQDYATGKYFEDYNYEYLFLDYFLYCATKEGYKDVESVYGNAKERREKKEAGDAALDDQQVEVTGLGGISTEKIGSYGADFLKEKGIKITTYSLEDSFLNNSVLNDTTNALFDESVTFSTIRNNLNQGKQVIIGAKNFSLYNV